MFKRLIMAITLIAGLAIAASPAVSAVDVFGGCNSNGSNISVDCSTVKDKSLSSTDKANNRVWRALSLAFVILAGIAVIMIVIGGLRYTLSNGDAGRVKSAKDTILYSVIGLVVALLATAIVALVNNFFG